MNKLDFYLVDDPREKPLRDAVYRAITRLTSRGEEDGEQTRGRMRVTASSAR
jgi:hypothetical protein